MSKYPSKKQQSTKLGFIFVKETTKTGRMIDEYIYSIVGEHGLIA